MINIHRKTAALHNLGCKVNSYETEAMQQMLEEDGYEIVDFSEMADVYVINTCSVTNMADRKSRQMLHRARKLNPDAVVVAAGCYVQTKLDEVKADLDINIIIGNNKKHELIEKLHEYFGNPIQELAFTEIGEDRSYEELKIIRTAEHTRAFIKIQDGCNQFCSYCIIPYARGRVRSRRTEDVLSEIGMLAQKGYQEVVLTGIHLSSFGTDTKESLTDLIRQVSEINEIKRIRLGSLEPRVVTEEFARELSQNPKLCPHFHLSLQSGCDETLKRMNRKYTVQEFEESCNRLREYFAHPAITTDVIVGFPMESDEEFKATKEYLEKIKFYEMHIFKYSKREGTKAATMSGQIPEQIKTKRSAELLDLELKMSMEFRDYYIGRTEEILLEDTITIDGTEYRTGYTKEYVKVAVTDRTAAQNTFVTGRIEKRLTDDYYLMVEF